MVKPIIQIGDPQLLQQSKPVAKDQIVSRGVKSLIQDLLDTCNDDPETTGGLSAVQIGELQRIFVININVDGDDRSTKPDWEVFINPEVKITSQKYSVLWEGCMSIGKGAKQLFGPVRRADRVEVGYLDQKGKPKTMQLAGFVAHVAQHEQDHLNGILFIKHVPNPDRNLWTSKALDEYIETYGSLPDVV